MKYWYLKGGDALGPMDPAEIVKDKDFTLDALVCPQDESDREESWRSPGDYLQDFGPFLKAAAEPADKKIAQAARLIEEISPEETIHSRSPLTAPLEDNLLDDLPAKAPLGGAAAARVEDAAQPAAIYDATPQPPDDTFTAANAVVLKSGGEDIAAAVESAAGAPKTAAAEPRRLQSLQPAVQPAQEAVAINIFDKQTLTSDHSAHADKPQQNIMPMGSGMTLTTTNGKIINTIDPRRPAAGGKKNDVLYILMFVMFIVIAVALFMAFFYKEDAHPPARPAEQGPAASQQQQRPPSQGLDEGIASPVAAHAVPQAQEVPPAEAIKTPALTQQAGNITVEGDNAAATTIAVRMVQEYLLDEKHGTIGEYLSQTYKDYKTMWNAQHLYNDSYTVEFLASKVRQEPVKYLFKINIQDRSLDGFNDNALNLLQIITPEGN
ncbi:MAG: hypothetical protein LBL61_06985 [Elusimicrobiota bacterium]|jgi:hypothetical protein|nr:hypothetical protein [Elusimicrobiota bacterium]